MKTTIQAPEKSYPYLAIYTGIDGDIQDIKIKDIIIISLLKDENGEERPYVSYVYGTCQGFFTKAENEYTRLPTCYKVILEQ